MAQEGVTVHVIPPELSREEALDRVNTDDVFSQKDVRVAAAPKYLFAYEVRLERLFFDDRVLNLSTTVDGMTGWGFRNDIYPEMETQSLPSEVLLETLVDQEEATEKSKSILRRYLNFQFATYIMIGKSPDITEVNSDQAYVLYWLAPHNWYESDEPKVTVFDSVTGDRLKTKVPLERVTAELFSL